MDGTTGMRAYERRRRTLARLRREERRGPGKGRWSRPRRPERPARPGGGGRPRASEELLDRPSVERPGDFERRELRAVEAALRRLVAGHYGVCRACAGPIEVVRLQALPEATLCAACAALVTCGPPRAEAGDRPDGETPSQAALRRSLSNAAGLR